MNNLFGETSFAKATHRGFLEVQIEVETSGSWWIYNK